VHENTIRIISDLSKKYGFNIVIPSSHVLFVSPSLNITPEVISNLNDHLKVVKLNYKPY
jgi:Skp family chaperone for outer membrane proteins